MYDSELFAKARLFIYRNARALDLARWRFHFEDADKSEVLAALSAYQNKDGGFGWPWKPMHGTRTQVPYKPARQPRFLTKQPFQTHSIQSSKASSHIWKAAPPLTGHSGIRQYQATTTIPMLLGGRAPRTPPAIKTIIQQQHSPGSYSAMRMEIHRGSSWQTA